jgi:hypothetical protein
MTVHSKRACALRLGLGLLVGLAAGCGGQTFQAGGSDGGALDSGQDGATHVPDAGADAAEAGEGADAVATQDGPPSVTADASTVTCTPGPGSGSGGSDSCEATESETCTDGWTYSADCRCPDAVCDCTKTIGDMSGGSSGGAQVAFDGGCPACPSGAAAWALCGYPH